jgi:hypothetical protein
MATMTVLITGKDNLDFPSILEAARVYPKAKALGCDRIRVEKLDGVRVADFPLSTVETFMRTYRLVAQPDKALRHDRGDYEFRRPVYPGWRKETT